MIFKILPQQQLFQSDSGVRSVPDSHLYCAFMDTGEVHKQALFSFKPPLYSGFFFHNDDWRLLRTDLHVAHNSSAEGHVRVFHCRLAQEQFYGVSVGWLQQHQ